MILRALYNLFMCSINFGRLCFPLGLYESFDLANHQNKKYQLPCIFLMLIIICKLFRFVPVYPNWDKFLIKCFFQRSITLNSSLKFVQPIMIRIDLKFLIKLKTTQSILQIIITYIYIFMEFTSTMPTKLGDVPYSEKLHRRRRLITTLNQLGSGGADDLISFFSFDGLL